MIKFIFFGRLAHEKWIDSIIEAFSMLHNSWITNRYLEIYGEWEYVHECEMFVEMFPRNVILHWRAPQQTIQHALQRSHYSLMPSYVIESFGMSALESIAEWVPVIWSKTWGLEQFIEDAYDTNTNPLSSILERCIGNFSLEKRQEESKRAQENAKRYTKSRWLKTVENERSTKRTFLISDYTSKIGGIESILFNIKKILEKEWASVEMIGWKIKKDKNLGLKKKIWLIATALNLPFFAHIHNEVREKRPTLIRLHSVSRFLWRMPIAGISSRKKSQVRCTIHDLGMFHPFGAEVRSTNMLPDFSLVWFMSVTKTFLQKLLVILKFANLRILKKQLERKVDLWVVPSLFMVDILSQKREIPKDKILVLPHFIP